MATPTPTYPQTGLSAQTLEDMCTHTKITAPVRGDTPEGTVVNINEAIRKVADEYNNEASVTAPVHSDRSHPAANILFCTSGNVLSIFDTDVEDYVNIKDSTLLNTEEIGYEVVQKLKTGFKVSSAGVPSIDGPLTGTAIGFDKTTGLSVGDTVLVTVRTVDPYVIYGKYVYTQYLKVTKLEAAPAPTSSPAPTPRVSAKKSKVTKRTTKQED